MNPDAGTVNPSPGFNRADDLCLPNRRLDALPASDELAGAEPDLPIICDSGEARKTEIDKILTAGANAYLLEPGDILILDNILTAHGRLPLSGTRKIALAMT